MTQTDTAAPPEPVDWDLAERVARRFAGREPIAASYLGGSLHADFSAVTTRAEQLVGDFTGLHAPGTASACVLDRPQWVHANVASMRRMLHPLTARVATGWPAVPSLLSDGAWRGPRWACSGSWPSVCSASTTCSSRTIPARRRHGCRVLRRRQHPRSREALRVPAPRFPSVDRDPRGDPPRPVHGDPVAEAVLPVAGRAGTGDRGPGSRAARAGDDARRRRAPKGHNRSTTGARGPLRVKRAARRARQGAGTHVTARGSRQQRHERAGSGAHRGSRNAWRGSRRVVAAGAFPASCTSCSDSNRSSASTRSGGVRRRGRAPAVGTPSTPGAAPSTSRRWTSSRPTEWLTRVA